MTLLKPMAVSRREFISVATSVTALHLTGCNQDEVGDGTDNPPICASTTFARGLTFADLGTYGAITYAVQSAQFTAQLPDYFDLSDEEMLADYGFGKVLPNVGDQGRQGSCVAWGVGYVAASLFNATGVASPADLYAKVIRREANLGNYCGNGTLIQDALDVLVIEGVANMSEVPYSDTFCSVPSQKSTVLMSSYYRIDVRDMNTIKLALNSFRALPIGMMVYPGFENARANEVYTESFSSCALGGHCVAIVGYDDTRKAFRLMNSWGTGWGDGGFLWMSYATFQRLVTEVYSPLPASGVFQGQSTLVPEPGNAFGLIHLEYARSVAWSGPTAEKPYAIYSTFRLNIALRLTSIRMEYVDQNSARSFVLSERSMRQWARALALDAPLTANQSAGIDYLNGIVRIEISGLAESGLPISLTARTRIATLR
jgi:hypothetical protein